MPTFDHPTRHKRTWERTKFWPSFNQYLDWLHRCTKCSQELLGTKECNDDLLHSLENIHRICCNFQPSICRGHKESLHLNQLCPPRNHPLWSMLRLQCWFREKARLCSSLCPILRNANPFDPSWHCLIHGQCASDSTSHTNHSHNLRNGTDQLLVSCSLLDIPLLCSHYHNPNLYPWKCPRRPTDVPLYIASLQCEERNTCHNNQSHMFYNESDSSPLSDGSL